MTTPKVPTTVVDKNGVTTTRHKNVEQPSSGQSRIATLTPSASSETETGISNFEHVLRNINGISAGVRQELLDAYDPNDMSVAASIIRGSWKEIGVTVAPILLALTKDDNAALPSLMRQHETHSVAERNYLFSARELDSDLRQRASSLAALSDAASDPDDLQRLNAKLSVIGEVINDWNDWNDPKLAAKGGFFDFALHLGKKVEALDAEPNSELNQYRRTMYKLAIELVNANA